MERSRHATTAKRGRRHDALRRTLRRQGVHTGEDTIEYEQVGGKRNTTPNTLMTNFQAIGISSELIPKTFAFLNNTRWYDSPSAAINYVTLIENQEAFLEIALAHVKKTLDISDGSTDTHIMEKISSVSDPSKLLEVFTTFFNILCLTDFETLDNEDNTCSDNDQSKIRYNFYKKTLDIYTKIKHNTSGKLESENEKYKLATILLHPTLLNNITVASIANILSTLSNDTDTQTLIGDTDVKNTLSFVFLVKKYTSYIFSTAYSLTSHKPRDSFFNWGCSETSEGDWDSFFIEFLKTVKNKTDKYLTEKVQIDSGAIKPKGQSTFSRTTSSEKFGIITGIVFNNRDKTKPNILKQFIGDGFSQQQPRQGVSTRSDSTPPPPILLNDITGMLPLKAWDQEFAPGVTFRKLLYRLSVPEVHYLLHLIKLFKPDETATTTATAGGGAAGASS